ncbi:unnamed protein product [Heligmosomoides polygyrus]|uniref:Uncharacterized protein n=1 Tax=Heligmosomoides polygyrus TaxID=6339 RepID=A0A183FNZ5_HELPZ|nr:unnamed protein product [Heligmosomoides polygyrus]
MILRIVFLFSAFSVAVANNFGPPCLPTRVNYKLHYPCLESAEDNEYEDRMSTLRGEPSAFARTGFYDRLFSQNERLPRLTGNYPRKSKYFLSTENFVCLFEFFKTSVPICNALFQIS